MTSRGMNREHSRLLNVHAWSEHKLVTDLVDKVFFSLPETEQQQIIGKSANKGKADMMRHLRVVLVDFYAGWKSDPTLCTAVGRSRNDYKTGSRYNGLHISPRVVKVYDALFDHGYVDMIKGGYNREAPHLSRKTRYRPTAKLQSLFANIGLETYQLSLHESQECIVLRDKDADSDKAKDIPYDDTNLTASMRAEVLAYNDMMSRHYVDVITLTAPYVVREKTNKGKPQTQHIMVDQSAKFTRRIFSRGDWEMNGRWYGGFWQNLSKEHRQYIHIDDEVTDEVDYSALHPSILAHQQGVKLTSDPYMLDQQVTKAIPMDEQRAVVKILVLISINAKDRHSAIKAFQKANKAYTKADLLALLDAFVEKHPYLSDSLCSDKGIRLMYLDSQITTHIINEFVALNKPILPIHDSYVVKVSDRELLRGAMRRASMAVLGVDLEAVSKFDESLGFKTLDTELSESEAEHAIDEIDAQYFEGAPEYLERYKKWFNYNYPDQNWSSYKLSALEELSSNSDDW